jgi:hypothetical protein
VSSFQAHFFTIGSTSVFTKTTKLLIEKNVATSKLPARKTLRFDLPTSKMPEHASLANPYKMGISDKSHKKK